MVSAAARMAGIFISAEVDIYADGEYRFRRAVRGGCVQVSGLSFMHSKLRVVRRLAECELLRVLLESRYRQGPGTVQPPRASV